VNSLAVAFKYHPDTNRAPDSSQKFREVQDAYNILSKPGTRQQYDVASSMSGKHKRSINYSGVAHNTEDVVAGFRKNYENNLRTEGTRIFHKSGDMGGTAGDFGSGLSREELRKLRRVQPVVDAGGICIALGGTLLVVGLVLGVSLMNKARAAESRAVESFNQKIRDANSKK
jgi:curved DNA-binding protein CbpA